MRDYNNMPVLDWNDEQAAVKAKAQILHQEPVILQMPDSFDLSIDGDIYGCELHGDTGIHYNCEAGRLLHRLADQNHQLGLDNIAEACIESGSQVDIDAKHKRIIVHD